MTEDFSKSVLPIVRKVREILLPHFGNAGIVDQKDGSASNVVTKLDKEVEQYLSRELSKIEPSVGFVGEEFGGDRSVKRFWLADPIDGTAHYIRGLPFCTTMLALIEDGQVIFSVIYDFINDIAYHAELGKGAYRNDERINVSQRPIENSYVGWESHIEKPENMVKTLALIKKSILVNTISAGYEYVLVATGKLEGRINFDPYGKDYDFVPGALLVSEAGGVVANIGKRNYDYRDVNFIAANKAVFKALVEGPDAIFPISK